MYHVEQNTFMLLLVFGMTFAALTGHFPLKTTKFAFLLGFLLCLKKRQLRCKIVKPWQLLELSLDNHPLLQALP